MRQKFLVILALAAVTLAAHWRVFQCDFVNYDDNDYITTNPLVQRGLTQEGLAWAWGQLHGEATYWHPITWMSHMLDCQLFGLKPAGHHGMNLLFHAVNVVLVFLVLERMTGARWRSALVAAIWAVHPINVDTVAWVSERKNVLSGMFWLLAMAAYARYAAKPGIGRYGLVFLAMALGLMCKPVLVTLPCALFLLDFWPLRRWRPKSWTEGGANAPPFAPASLKWLFVEKIPLFALSVVSAILTHRVHDALGLREEIYRLTTNLKIQNALVSIVRYIDNAFWPTKLTVLYLHPGVWPLWKVVFCTVVVFLITGIAIWRVRSRPYLLVGWLWFLGVMVPFLGLRQAGMQAMADRFAYLPILGLLVMIVWTAGEWVAGRSIRAIVPAAAAAAAVIAALALMTMKQTAHWRNGVALWERAVVVDERNDIAHYNLATAYIATNQIEGARAHAIEAIRLGRPQFLLPRILLGLIALQEQKPEDAAQHFDLALRAFNDAPGMFLQAAQDVAIKSNLAGSMAMLYAYLKRFPESPEVRFQLAAMLSGAGRAAEAQRLFRELLAAEPDHPAVLNNYAWLLATTADPAFRNGAEAVRLAERACELTGRKEALIVGTLAAAYAEAGRFEDAVRAAQQAIELAKAARIQEIVDRNRQLIELYRASKPFHLAPPK